MRETSGFSGRHFCSFGLRQSELLHRHRDLVRHKELGTRLGRIGIAPLLEVISAPDHKTVLGNFGDRSNEVAKRTETVRYLGVEVDDALRIAEQIELSISDHWGEPVVALAPIAGIPRNVIDDL